MILVAGVGAGGNKSIYLPQLHPVVQHPGLLTQGPADPGARETIGGLEVPASVLPSWLGIREGPEWEITELTQNWASKA